jgi:hypothetical protein
MFDISVAKLIYDALPFMILATSAPQTVNKTRIIEAVITAAVVGVIVAYAGMYVALPVLKEQIDQLRISQTDTKQIIKDMRDDMERRAAKRDALQAITDVKITQLQIEVVKRK